MFDFFKRRQSAPTTAELTAEAHAAIADIGEQWVVFYKKIQPSRALPLAATIDAFSQSLMRDFRQRHPQLIHCGPQAFWFTMFNAIIQAGTHPREEITAVSEQLRIKYSSSPERPH